MNQHVNSVELVGTYGGDLTHALSAWTSTAREMTEKRRMRLSTFLKDLAKNGHHSPFEKSTLHFLAVTDIATHIHLLKHRIGVSVNSESARYMEQNEDKFYLPTDWDSEDVAELEAYVNESFRLYHKKVADLERKGFTRSRAKESARFFLPYAFQYKVDLTFNFRSFMHFQGLRNHGHAQLEVRNLAKEMLRLIVAQGGFRMSLDAFQGIQLPAPTWTMEGMEGSYTERGI